MLNFNTSYVVVQLERSLIKERQMEISIHLMLWFNTAGDNPNTFCYNISIHLMLWFNHNTSGLSHFFFAFQYILCCGSTLDWLQNSTYQDISIHLMLWFNKQTVIIDQPASKYFNTSYVVVQQK